MEQQLLLKSSNNLTEMIKLLKIHEETISRITRARAVTDTQIVDLFNVVITNENLRLNNRDRADNTVYLETPYSEINTPISTSCPITREDFLDTDVVIMIRECRHIFKKTAFLSWIENNNTCPCCRITLPEV
jgi:hypothetical protein